MRYILPNGVYDVLKWLAVLALPAAATLYGVIGPLWGWPAVDSVVVTINAVGVFIGTLIGVSAVTAKPIKDEQPKEGEQEQPKE